MAKRISKSDDAQSQQVSSYWQKLENEVQTNQSRVSMVLGGLIILVLVLLVFNFFNKNKSSLGPAQNTESSMQDVSPENLPGKYTVKEDDTLFTIAQKYYNDGYKYTEIAKANNLTNPDQIEKDQVLEIPKLEAAMMPEASTQPTVEATPIPASQGQMMESTSNDWGPKIDGSTYTVVEDDWLSKIAARAYGDIYAYDRIAKANNIVNPNHIEVGQVLEIPR